MYNTPKAADFCNITYYYVYIYRNWQIAVANYVILTENTNKNTNLL